MDSSYCVVIHIVFLHWEYGLFEFSPILNYNPPFQQRQGQKEADFTHTHTVLSGRQVLQLNLRTSVSLVLNKKQTHSLSLWGTTAKSKIGVKEVLHCSPKKREGN